MKRISIISLVAALFLTTGSAIAQSNLKFGHINLQELISVMPGRDSAEMKFNAFYQELIEQSEELEVEYNNKLQTFNQKQATFSDAIREMRQKELIDLERRIQEFQANAPKNIQTVQGQLMQPLIEKANETIKKVAKQQGFLYVFDVSSGGVVYFSEASVDVLPFVKKELGIK
jgi:outer membrane protein